MATKDKLVNLEDLKAVHDIDSAEIGGLKSAVEQTQNIIETKATVIYETASAPMASFTDGADDMPLKQCVVQIEPVQNGDGDPSPENIRPIDGWTGETVTHAGLNLFGGTLMRDGVKHNLPTAVDHPDEGYISYTSGASVTGYRGFTELCGLSRKFKENTAYTFIITYSKTSGNDSNMRIYYTDGTTANVPPVSATNTKETKIVVTPANRTVKRFEKTNMSGTTNLYYNESGIFEGDLTAEDFVPYNGASYPVTFPAEAGMVYGGTLTINQDGSGNLIVDRALITLTGEESYTKADYDNMSIYYANVLPNHKVTNTVWSDRYTFTNVTVASMPNYSIKSNNSNTSTAPRIYIRDDRYTTVKDFKANVAGTQVLYELRTPVTYMLSALNVNRTLFGVNSIFADAGPVSIEYAADTKLYIDNQTKATRNLIAGIETEMIASKNYVEGDLLIVGDTLYKVSVPIANGAAFTPGTNVVSTTVAEQLLLLANA